MVFVCRRVIKHTIGIMQGTMHLELSTSINITRCFFCGELVILIDNTPIGYHQIITIYY